MLSGPGSPGGGAVGDELLTVTVSRDDHGYGMKVSGDNPVYVQSVKEAGAAWRAGLRAGDRILRVDGVPVHTHTHQQVVHMIRANPSTVLTVHQNTQRYKTPITAPVPVNPEKQRQVEYTKVNTFKLMLEKEQKYIRELRIEVSKVPDVRKQAELEAVEQRCIKLQHEIATLLAAKTSVAGETDIAPRTPKLAGKPKLTVDKGNSSPPPNASGFLSGLPRSLSNLTGQSLRNLRQNITKSQETQPAPTDVDNRRRHNNTVPLVPTTCLDTLTLPPPPLPPRAHPHHRPPPPLTASPMHRSLPPPQCREDLPRRRSSLSLDGEVDGPRPNSIAMQMSYPLVNVPPPPLQTDNRNIAPVLHMRSLSSPEQSELGGQWDTPGPPPGTPPPPYLGTVCVDPQRAIISMEEEDSPPSEGSTYSGLFSNLRSVRDSKARMAVLLNWLLAEKRCACANLLLLLTDGYRNASGVTANTLRRWAFEIHSTFLAPNAAMALNGVDENMANEIERVLEKEYDKEELLRNVFRKARQKAKDELTRQLTEFQVKRQVGLGTLYGPEDSVLEKCDVDKQQELIVVERLMSQSVQWACGGALSCGGRAAQGALQGALVAVAHTLHCRPQTVAAAAGGARAAFLQREKHYKQRLKHLTKQNPLPLVVRGHHLTLHALTSAGHCHHCDLAIWGLAPQAYVCTDCDLRVHCACALSVEESCCLDGEHHNNRISRFIDRIHHTNNAGQDSGDRKSKKPSNTGYFLNMERSFRRLEDDLPWDSATALERRDESDESLYESADCHSDAISASDDALPRLTNTPNISKESLKLAITDEEVELVKNNKKGHRKAMSLSNPLEIVKNLGDEWLEAAKRELDKNSDKKKSRESLWSEEDRDFVHGSNVKLDHIRKNSKKEDKNNRKNSTAEVPKTRKTSKASSVSALNFLRRKKTPASICKTVEAVAEVVDKLVNTDEILNYTKFFLEEEKRHTALCESKPASEETDSDEEPKVAQKSIITNGEHRRRLSRQTSRTKSKVRGKSQTVKINTLRKSHSGTLKKAKKKGVKTPVSGRSRQASFAEPSVTKSKNFDVSKHNTWLFSSSRESKREGSSEEAPVADPDTDLNDAKDYQEKENSCRQKQSVRSVNRAESCRERDAPHGRRGKQRNASDPNRLTAPNNNQCDLEPGPGAVTAPSGSSSSSSLSSKSNESNTVPAEQQHASQSEWSEDEEPLCSVWTESLPPHALDALALPPRHRKRQEVVHELIVSEGSHVRWLKVLGNVFLRPLERGEHAHLLAADELHALFPNLPAVRERHARLYGELRALRGDGDHIVHIRPLADAMLNTLGEPSYASCLSRFCRGQRLALEVLRERRRKSKELHQFLSAREQMPHCGRLQLRDLLACVWQRLTKYQLLLENILKTVEDEDSESEEDVARLKRALDTAKEVLHGVDTAIRTAENQHRLKTIQSKLEVRGASADQEELRRLELTQHTLKLEGELNIRNDNNKKITVLALMMSECLVLLQREGDKFLLKPITAPNQQALSPMVKWSTVLFRPNAAMKNTFFLMNINGVQMHELSTNTAAEYATWSRHIQQAPLAEARAPLRTPAAPHRQTDDTGTTVSRNSSDASEKSSTAIRDDPPEAEAPSGNERSSAERDEGGPTEGEDGTSAERETPREERETKRSRRPCGRVSTHGVELTEPLEDGAAVRVLPPAAETLARTADTALSPRERLRRLDATISRAMMEKTTIVAALLGVPPDSYAEVAEMAVADTLGHVDVTRELLSSAPAPAPEEAPPSPCEADMHQLLLAAHAQAHQLTEVLVNALRAEEADVVAGRAPGSRRGLCDRCASSRRHGTDVDLSSPERAVELPAELRGAAEGEGGGREGGGREAALALRLSGLVCGLRGTLGRMVSAVPELEGRREALRAELVGLREGRDRDRHQEGG